MNEVFQVVKKEDHDEIREVYDVRNNNCGYPHFLIYENGEWKYVSAKHFVPYSRILQKKKDEYYMHEIKITASSIRDDTYYKDIEKRIEDHYKRINHV